MSPFGAASITSQVKKSGVGYRSGRRGDRAFWTSVFMNSHSSFHTPSQALSSFHTPRRRLRHFTHRNRFVFQWVVQFLVDGPRKHSSFHTPRIPVRQITHQNLEVFQRTRDTFAKPGGANDISHITSLAFDSLHTVFRQFTHHVSSFHTPDVSKSAATSDAYRPLSTA